MKVNFLTILGIAAVGLAVLWSLTRRGEEGEAEHQTGHSTNSSGPESRNSEWAEARMPPNRKREATYQSYADSEQALLDYDITDLVMGDEQERKLCYYRLRRLVVQIPEEHYRELAANFGKGSGNNLKQYFLQMTIYLEWGKADFDAALANLAAIENEKRHSKALHNIFTGVTEQDAEKAMKMALSLDIETPGEFGDFERIDLMDTVFDKWLTSDPHAALEWARQSSVPDKRRQQWEGDALRAWNEVDPEAVQRWREQNG